MKVAIYSRGLDDKQRIPLLALITELHKHDVSILVSASLAQKYWDEMAAIDNLQVFETNLDRNTDCLIRRWHHPRCSYHHRQ